MTRYLLDANIISDAIKPAPSEPLADWFVRQSDESLVICSFTLAEILRGIMQAPQGKRRRDLEAWFAGPHGPQSRFAGRILPFDEAAAIAWAHLMAEGTARGRPRNPLDTLVSAIAHANDCVVVTRNDKHFPGVRVFNPWVAR